MRLGDLDALKAQIQQDYDIFKDSINQLDIARRDELINVIARIVNAPTVDAVPVKHGYWKYNGLTFGLKDGDECCDEYVCSECGKGNMVIPPGSFDRKNKKIRYCFNCGAKMDGGTDDAGKT